MVFVLSSQVQAQKTIAPLRERLDLSGTWSSTLGDCRLPGTTDENKLGNPASRKDVTSQLTRLYAYCGPVTYTRTVDIPQSMAACPMVLCMERTKPSTLWIDGDSVGSICQLYCAHEYQLPTLSAGRHEIRIRIDNSDGAVPDAVHGSHAWAESTQTNWNGILGDFYIEARPHAYINKVYVYPDVDGRKARVRMTVVSDKALKTTLTLNAEAYNTQQAAAPLKHREAVVLTAGENTVEATLSMGDAPLLWSEFHPALYRLTARIGAEDEYVTSFGMRKFGIEGTQFVINGNKTFLRGTHDACVFPLTAYCPTDVYEWQRVFRIAKAYGINHYRFHSYTPTEAAFVAADLEGIYLQCELPVWGTIEKKNGTLNDFLLHEAHGELDAFGNHPSFMSMGLGNELWGEADTMAEWLEGFRKQDDRHLYCFGSNNWLGWQVHEGEDYMVTCRVGGGEHYSANTRTSFSFADEDEGGLLNHTRPNTRDDFSLPVSKTARPIVAHETCQFQMYPNYNQIGRYKGVLYPYNLEVFRSRLDENGLTDQSVDFVTATTAWGLECYKADIEYCVRTKGFGGYQLLDLKDYPGQGSALCGILDAFMNQKSKADAKVVNVMQPVVPMLLMDKYCWSNEEEFKAHIALCTYTEGDWNQPIEVVVKCGKNMKTLTTACHVGQGDVLVVDSLRGMIFCPEDSAVVNTITLKTGNYSNEYNVWVYPEVKEMKSDVMMADTLDAAVLKALEKGRTVLLAPSFPSIEKQSIGGLFTPDYWNYAMFKTISENNGKPVSPGSLGMLMDKLSPLFDDFPTEGYTDWQWWCVAKHSRPLILNSLPKDYRPIIQTVDNVERNHKLGILMEFKCGKGKLLICTTDLESISDFVEGRAYRNAVMKYAQTFNPTTEITPDALRTLLYSETKIRDIQGVKNETDYKH